MPSSLFITATGTDIGKTYITCLLLKVLRKHNIGATIKKPVVSGITPHEPEPTSDTALLCQAAGLAPTMDHYNNISPWRLSPALSPDMAANIEGVTLNYQEICSFCTEATTPPLTIIEGVGGVMSPICEGKTCLDLIKDTNSTVILVTGSYLGAVSHTLTALESLKARNASPELIILNESTNSIGLTKTQNTLNQFTKTPIIQVTQKQSELPFTHISSIAAIAS